MSKIFSFGFWNSVASIILRNRIIIIFLVLAATAFFATQWKNIQFSYTEANLLPDDHEANLTYNSFLDTFGEEGNLVILGVKDSTLFTPEKFQAWTALNEELESYSEVDHVISVSSLKKLEKFNDPKRFEMVPFIEEDKPDKEQLKAYENELFTALPFYENLVYSSHSNTIQSALYINKEIVNSEERKDFVLEKLRPLIKEFEEIHEIDVKVSGMPYIRTLNSQNIIDEIGLFILASRFQTLI